MEAVREWAFSICASMVACGIALQLMPKTNLTSIFKLVVSVFFMCCLLSPIIIRFPSDIIELEQYSSEIAEEKASKLADVIEKQTRHEAERSAQKIIADKLRQMGINYYDITININTNGQSEAVDRAEIILDKELEPQHEKLLRQLKDSLQMDVRLLYAEGER